MLVPETLISFEQSNKLSYLFLYLHKTKGNCKDCFITVVLKRIPQNKHSQAALELRS